MHYLFVHILVRNKQFIILDFRLSPWFEYTIYYSVCTVWT